MIKNQKKGFTLIELLVVIAIIGILAATVLASLSTARNKAKDAKVQSEMSSLRAAAELFYSTGSTYGTDGATCNAASSVFVDVTSNTKGLLDAISFDTGGAIGTYTNMDCGNTSSAWSVAAKLPTGSSYFCVDSTGTARNTDAAGTPYTGIIGGATPAHGAANGAVTGGTVCN